MTSIAELRKLEPAYDHSGQIDHISAAQLNGGKPAWDRPLSDYERTHEVHGFMRRVVEAFRANGCNLIYHTHDSRKCAAGFPDLRMIHHGYPVVAELKLKGRLPEPEQREWLDAEAAVSDTVFLWYPSDWEFICRFAKAGILEVGEPSRWVNRRGKGER